MTESQMQIQERVVVRYRTTTGREVQITETTETHPDQLGHPEEEVSERWTCLGCRTEGHGQYGDDTYALRRRAADHAKACAAA